MATVPDALHPRLNPTGLAAGAGAIYAASVMIFNAANHHGVISVPVIIAAVAAIIALFTRTIVTPVAAPKDGAGNPLVPIAPPPVTVLPAATTATGTVTILPSPVAPEEPAP